MSGTEHPNAAVLREAYAAFARSDLDAVARVLAPEVAWHIPGAGPFAGDHHGRAAVLGLLGALAAHTAGTLRQRLHDVLASDDHGVVLLTEEARRAGTGPVVTVRLVHVFHLDAGAITELWEAPVDAAAYAELLGPEPPAELPDWPTRLGLAAVPGGAAAR